MNMTVLVTGAAGFIGYHTINAILDRGQSVIGIDNLNDYYDVSLKEARRDRLLKRKGMDFIRADIADKEIMLGLVKKYPQITHVVHLAAQAGVRYSLVNPYAYTRANIEGQLVFLEICRELKNLEHAIYASSSSVYGTNTKLPFAVSDRTDTPVSLYAATKKSVELMSHSYSHMFSIPLTGFRFFTVYGPWGRPDMSAFIFIRKILENRPIPVFNNGDMGRDFTYIDDIVAGLIKCLYQPPKIELGLVPCRLYNLGNNRSEKLMTFISLIEEALGKKAKIEFLPMQPGDVRNTFANIDEMTNDFGFTPKTTIEIGIPKLVKWYRDFYKT